MSEANKATPVDISHKYTGMGESYDASRQGAPPFANFVLQESGFTAEQIKRGNIIISEFGAGGGQQTELVDNVLREAGVNYKILALDRSYAKTKKDKPGQLNILAEKIESGRISSNVIPMVADLNMTFPIRDNSIDLAFCAYVLHHIKNKKNFFTEAARIIKPGGRFFVLGGTLEDLEKHFLNEFFPDKPSYDAIRYSSTKDIESFFEESGFEYRTPYVIENEGGSRPVDELFLKSVINMSVNSVLVMIAQDDPEAFARGVEMIRKIVEEGEKSGNYRIFPPLPRTIHWGVKK